MRIFNQTLSAYLLYDGSYHIPFRLKLIGENFAIEMTDEDGSAIMAVYHSRELAENQLAAVRRFCSDTSKLKKDFFFSRDKE